MKNIFVGNLSFSTTEEELRSMFFVEMSNDAEAEAAINALNGKSIAGRRLNVNEARPKAERGGGGYRDSGGGRPARERRW